MASEIRVNQIQNRSGLTTVTWNDEGLNVVGVVTATSFSGPITGSTGTFGGDVTIDGDLGVSGTITYEDVARVDALGISTFREGLNVGPLAGIALTAYKDGSIRTTGIITASSFSGNGAVTINNNATTKFITGTNNANELDCEANLSYNNSVVTFSSSSLMVDKSASPTISAKETSGNKEVQLRADTTGGLLRTVGSYPLVLATNQTERLRITSTGDLKFSTGSRTGNVNSICAANGHSIDLNGSEYLYFGTGGTERCRITLTGQMGLGVSTIQANAKLQVNGNIGAAQFYTTTTTAPQTDFNSDVSTNKAGLLLRRTSETNGDYGGIEFHNHPSSNTLYRKGGIYFQSNGSGFGRGDIVFVNDGAGDSANVAISDEKMRIWANGAVTKPGNFTFLVASGGTSVTTGWQKLTGLSINTANSNWGDTTYWDQSNQRFTVPITGTYMLFFGGWGNQNRGGSTNDRYATCFRINTGSFTFIQGSNYSNVDSPLSSHCLTNRLTSGQYVELWYYNTVNGTWGGGHNVYWGATLLA